MDRLYHTVARSGDLGVRLTDTDVRSRIATARAGVHWRCSRTIKLFVLFLDGASVTLPC